MASASLRLHKRITSQYLFAGEGRFTELLKIAKMTEADFAKIAGMDPTTVRGWYGFPMHGWPIALLEAIIFRQKATPKLEHHGYPKEMFEPGELPEFQKGKGGLTTKEDGERMLRELGLKE